MVCSTNCIICAQDVPGVYPSNDAALEVVNLCKFPLVDQLLGILATPNSNGAADTEHATQVTLQL